MLERHLSPLSQAQTEPLRERYFAPAHQAQSKLTGLKFNQSFPWKLTKLWIVRPAAGSFHGECVQSRLISYFDNYFMHRERLLSRDERGLRSAGAGRSVKFMGGG